MFAPRSRPRDTSTRLILLTLLTAGAAALAVSQTESPAWLAGDSHIHSHWSPGYNREVTPPVPIIGGDARYSTPVNAQKAKDFGLRWMVTTDHGGPNHSKLNLAHAYTELGESRRAVPQVLQFYGMEFNMPAMDHHTLIIPNTEDEWRVLFNIESQFDRNEVFPADPARNTEAFAAKALAYMNALPRLPLMFANHPSRSAKGVGVYGSDEPREFRSHNDLAPEIYRGMEGAPGHQAGTLARDGAGRRNSEGQPAGNRGGYGNDAARTFGGFDQMTAIVGGLWDALLGEGRRFWIVATSDSHVHFSDGGSDFWPGEYQKTYVWARHSYTDILDGLRAGRIFVVAGDLIDALDVTARTGQATATVGQSLSARAGEDVQVEIRFGVPSARNARGDRPPVARVDLIAGDVRGPAADRSLNRNETTRVVARFTAKDWRCAGGTCTIAATLPKVSRSGYLRVRGTSTTETEPSMDPAGENPWTDLWFYANPIFFEVAGS
jgi:hypothetical protein